jgi:hypothetical protein
MRRTKPWGLPFARGELKFPRSQQCPTAVPTLDPPVSKPFVKAAKIAAVFFGPETGEK